MNFSKAQKMTINRPNTNVSNMMSLQKSEEKNDLMETEEAEDLFDKYDSDPVPADREPKLLKKIAVFTLEEIFDTEGVCIAITLLKKGLLKIAKQPSDKTLPDQRVKNWIRKLEKLRDDPRYSNGIIRVPYRKTLLPNSDQPFGRANAIGLSSQQMPRKLRALLFGNYYKDIDMINAHPTILVSLYPKFTTELAKYVKDRKAWLQEVMDIHNVSRDEAKTLFLTPLNSKDPMKFYKNWCRVQLDNDNTIIRARLPMDPLLRKKFSKLSKEIVGLRRYVLEKHPEFVFYSKKNSTKEEHAGTFFNKFLTTEESKAIQVVKNELQRQGCQVDSIIHDGCHKLDREECDIESINAELKKQWPLLEVKMKDFEMPSIPKDLEIERRHPFNSCQPASQVSIMSPSEIYDKFKTASQVVYQSEAAVFQAVEEIAYDYMNMTFARLSEKKPVIVQRSYGDYVENNTSFNDGSAKASKYQLKQRLIEYKQMTKTDALQIFTREFEFCYKFESGENDKNGEPIIRKKRIHALKMWYDSINAINYQKEVFNPNIGRLPADHLNRYSSYAVEPSKKSFEECVKICAPLLDHIKEIWANGEDEGFEYIMAWLSHTVKFPWLKIGIAMVILGEKRCGKGIVIAFLLAIFGQHASEITQGEHATGNFNAALMDKVFISMNESSWGGNQQGLGVMRGMITDSQMQGTRKGIDTKTIRNFLDFIFSSNFMHVVCNKLGELRYYITRCDPKYAAMSKTVTPEDKKAHMDEIAAIPVPVVLKLLLHWKIPDTINLKVPPYTAAQQEQTEHSMTTVQQYILGCLRGEWPRFCTIADGRRNDVSIWGKHVDKNVFYDHYKRNFGTGTANTKPLNQVVFWKNIRATEAEHGCNLQLGFNGNGKSQELTIQEFVPEDDECRSGSKKRVNCMLFPTLANAKKQFLELADKGFVI